MPYLLLLESAAVWAARLFPWAAGAYIGSKLTENNNPANPAQLPAGTAFATKAGEGVKTAIIIAALAGAGLVIYNNQKKKS